jgi:hypothetical protein
LADANEYACGKANFQKAAIVPQTGGTNMINKTAIVAGAVGGVGPNLLRLIINYSSPNPHPMINQPFSYCLALLGFAALGGFVAWGLEEKDFKRALFIGIGLPAMFQLGSLQSLPSSSTAPPSDAPPLAGIETSFSLISSAYAQPPAGPSAAVHGRKLHLTGDHNLPSYTVAFYGPDNKLRSTQTVTNPASQDVEVPDTATKFALQLGESTSRSYELLNSASAVIRAEVKIHERAASGFLQGVGLAHGGRYEIEVHLQ